MSDEPDIDEALSIARDYAGCLSEDASGKLAAALLWFHESYREALKGLAEKTRRVEEFEAFARRMAELATMELESNPIETIREVWRASLNSEAEKRAEQGKRIRELEGQLSEATARIHAALGGDGPVDLDALVRRIESLAENDADTLMRAAFKPHGPDILLCITDRTYGSTCVEARWGDELCDDLLRREHERCFDSLADALRAIAGKT